MNNERNDNNIGDSGACSIGEGLKMNSTLTILDLYGAFCHRDKETPKPKWVSEIIAAVKLGAPGIST